jgi:hypothetical protein
MDHTYKIATLNINGIGTYHRITMLDEFLRAQDIELLCVQEVTNDHIRAIPNYTIYLNIGAGAEALRCWSKMVTRLMMFAAYLPVGG